MHSFLSSLLKLHVLYGDFLGPTTDNQGAGFDLKLLRKLPEELLWEVLQRLPYSVKARFGTVSKSWYSKLLSEESLKSSAANALPSPSPLVCGLEFMGDPYSYIPIIFLHETESSRRKLYELNLSFLPNECLNFCSPNISFVQEGVVGVLEVHWGVGVFDLNTVQIFLFNPMTRTAKKLPTLLLGDAKQTWTIPGNQKWRIKLQLDQSSVSSGRVQFQLVLLLSGSDCPVRDMSVGAICTYSSHAEKWTVTQLEFHRVYTTASRAVCGEFIYTITDDQWLAKHSLLDGKLYGEHTLQSLQIHQTHRQLLVGHRGDLLCVQQIPSGVEDYPTFVIWKLDPTSLRWSELTRMPRRVLDRFLARVQSKDDFELRWPPRSYSVSSAEEVGEFICLNISDDRFVELPLVYLFMCHIPTKRWDVGVNFVSHGWERKFHLLPPRLDVFL